MLAFVTAALPEVMVFRFFPIGEGGCNRLKYALVYTNSKREGTSGSTGPADDFHIFVTFLFVLVGAAGFMRPAFLAV